MTLSDYAERDRESVLGKVENELVTEIIPTLRQHKSQRMGGMSRDDHLLLPPRLTEEDPRDWPRYTSMEPEFVLCHGDLSQENVLIDPHTHKIRAIIDWEYGGYYPPMFEAQLWRYHPCKQDWDAHKPKELWSLLEDFAGKQT